MTAATKLGPEGRERPILFSAPMVRAILEGRKTVTRRVVKFEHASEVDAWAPLANGVWEVGVSEAGAVAGMGTIRCPYGQPGDRLYVRERLERYALPHLLTGQPTNAMCARYSADGEPVVTEHGSFEYAWEWKNASLPSIHCPRWASRITLPITNIRVERLQDISEEDAKAEGFEPVWRPETWTAYDSETDAYPSFFVKPEGERYENIRHHPAEILMTARDAFRRLWDELNGSRPGCAWEDSPWVWVVGWVKAEVRHG